MITQEEEKHLRECAYVPEHIVPLMVGISRAEPFFQEDHLFFLKDDCMILVGYPLGGDLQDEVFPAFLAKLQKKFQPATTWLVAPGIPPGRRSSGSLPGKKGKKMKEC